MRKHILVFNLMLALMLALGTVALAAPITETSTNIQTAKVMCPEHATFQPGVGCVCDPGYREVGRRPIDKVTKGNADEDVAFVEWACVPIDNDLDGDGVPDNQDVCPDQGDNGYGVNRFDADLLGCPNLPPNFIEFWPGNPNSPTFDGRMNSGAADPYTAYCQNGQLQIYDANGFITQIALSAVQGMTSPLSFGDGAYTVARSGDSLVVSGPPDDFRIEFSLADCLSRDAE